MSKLLVNEQMRPESMTLQELSKEDVTRYKSLTETPNKAPTPW